MSTCGCKCGWMFLDVSCVMCMYLCLSRCVGVWVWVWVCGCVSRCVCVCVSVSKPLPYVNNYSMQVSFTGYIAVRGGMNYPFLPFAVDCVPIIPGVSFGCKSQPRTSNVRLD